MKIKPTERPKGMVFGPCSLKQQMILLDESSDILLCGGGAGGGKSHTCLTKALKYVQDPHARVLIVRESYPTLKLSGGLVDESQSIYSQFGAVFKVQPLEWHFPNGATIKFAAIPKNLKEWQGLQATHILVDEAADFTQDQILFLMSRLRGAKCKIHQNLTMTCNPDRNSFLYPWVEYCLDPETGIPVDGTEDITRYFVNLNGKIFWGDSKEQLFKDHGHGKKMGKDFIPLSFRFIPLTIYDNPVLLKNNPSYLANLLSQPRVNQQRFLYGSWTARPSGSSMFNRSWVEFVDEAPKVTTGKARSWDLADTVPSETNPDPDWTAGVRISRDNFGMYYVEHVNRFRKQSDGVIKEIIVQGDYDGKRVTQTIPRDPGAGGKVANRFYVGKLAEKGIVARSIPTPTHSSKKDRFMPFCTLAEAGCVKIVKGAWNDDYLTELEHFTGERKGHDDQVDATSDAFNTVCRGVEIPSFALPMLVQASPIQSV